MVLIFALSAMMLHPRTRVIFKAPVPHIHDQIGKVLIPWGLTYLIFLPDFYLLQNGVEWRDHAYIVVSMLTSVIILSVSVWAFLAMLQQKVNHRLLQPLILCLPCALMVWYTVSPVDWLLDSFTYVLVVEIAILVCYYVRMYRAFVIDLKANYSSISTEMLHAMRVQWAITLFAFLIFGICMVYDHVVWNIIDIFTNLICIYTFIYTSEHLMPIPEAVEDGTVSETEVVPNGGPDPEITQALYLHCETKRLFCNPDLSLQDLALAVGTNRTYLGKWLAAKDTNFYTYINGLRVEYARELLLTTDIPVSQILLDAGFTSKTTFRKYFMERFGCSPTEYRKK